MVFLHCQVAGSVPSTSVLQVACSANLHHGIQFLFNHDFQLHIHNCILCHIHHPGKLHHRRGEPATMEKRLWESSVHSSTKARCCGACVCVTHLNRCKTCTFVCGPLADAILLNPFNLQGAGGRIDGTGQRRPIYVAGQTYLHFFHLLSWDAANPRTTVPTSTICFFNQRSRTFKLSELFSDTMSCSFR